MPGFYNELAFQTSSTSCLPCRVAGTYSSVGASTCLVCPAGSYCPPGGALQDISGAAFTQPMIACLLFLPRELFQLLVSLTCRSLLSCWRFLSICHSISFILEMISLPPVCYGADISFLLWFGLLPDWQLLPCRFEYTLALRSRLLWSCHRTNSGHLLGSLFSGFLLVCFRIAFVCPSFEKTFSHSPLGSNASIFACSGGWVDFLPEVKF